MHFHANQINLRESAMSTAQAAENALSSKRVKELREAAAKLKASALDNVPEILSDQEGIAMVNAWAGNHEQLPSATSTVLEETSITPKPAQGVSFWA